MQLFSRQKITAEAKKYEGYDWCEVATAIGVKPGNSAFTRCELCGSFLPAADPETAEMEKQLQLAHAELVGSKEGHQVSQPTKDLVLAARAYTVALIEPNITWCGPLWKGLSEIQDDEAFLKYFTVLYQHMWQ